MKSTTRYIFAFLTIVVGFGFLYSGTFEGLVSAYQSIHFAKKIWDLFKILIVQNFDRILYYFITLFGAAAFNIFTLHQGFDGSIGFLRHFFPKKSELFYHRVDFFICVIIGSIIGFIFFSPHSTIEALAAGFSWQGAITVMMNKGVS